MSGAGKVVADKKASGDRARVFFKNGTASKVARLSGNALSVRARSTRCDGAPRMVVKVDGDRALSRLVRAGVWRSYRAAVEIPDGEHNVAVSFVNERKTARCDRNLYVDKLSVGRSASRSVALGAFVGGYPDYPLNARPLDDYVSMTGKTPALVNWFQDWSGGFVPEHFEDVSRRGAVPMVTWCPQNYPKYGNQVRQPEYALRRIAAGDHDAYIRRYAQAAAAWGKPMYLRFAHEMNGDWYPWGVGANGNTAAHYVAAWRHVHAVFEREGATNVRWVWSPNVAVAGSAPFGGVYPGDAYVDWAALDGYNWGTADRGGWRGFSEVFGPSYERVARITGKPVMIAETSSAETGGNKAEWIRQALLRDVPERFPRVKAVVWFNIDLERDWRVNSSAGSLSAYKEVVNSPVYQGKMP